MKIAHCISSFLAMTSLFGIMSCHTTPKEKTKEEIASQNETLLNVNKYLVGKDADLIRSYAERRGWKMTTTQTGLWYMIAQKGTGKAAVIGKMAEINYRISLLDGTLCYSSEDLGPKKFKIGQGGVESGLEEGILLMHEGDKANFVMPPHLAYGLMGDEKKIPARAIILYEVELLKTSD
jgi:FKBP-type peptidyl-prolyl cis-trans isomerase FkpA